MVRTDTIAERRPVAGMTADELCRVYAADVCRFAAALSKSRPDAEDLAQDALLRAVRSLHTYDATRGSMRTWLWRIVANAARDAAGRRKRMADVVVRLGALAPRETDTVEGKALARMRDAEIHTHMRALPIRDQTLLALRYTAGLETHEVAEVMGLSTDTASRAIRRALARLRARLEERPR